MDRPTRALSVRQPWAELILRGDKRCEFRRRPTRVVGERVYLYASKGPGPAGAFARMRVEPGDLPTGLLVGTAVVAACRPTRPGEVVAAMRAAGATDGADAAEFDRWSWAWELSDVRRLAVPVAPTRHPQPTWFRPFERAAPARRNRRAA